MPNRDKQREVPAGVEASPYVLKRGAAAFCMMSVRSFERHVMREVPSIRLGGRVLFDLEDIRRWVDARKVVPVVVPEAPIFIGSGSPTAASAGTSPRGQRIRAKLQARRGFGP